MKRFVQFDFLSKYQIGRLFHQANLIILKIYEHVIGQTDRPIYLRGLWKQKT